MRRIMIAAGLVLSGALLASGCQLVGGGDNENKPSGKAAPSAGATSPAASAAVPAPAKKSTTYQALGPGGTVTVGFQGLQVRGQLAVLSLTWTPKVPGGSIGNIDHWNVSQMISGQPASGGNVTLVDGRNLKRYVIVQDSHGHLLGSNGDNGDLTINNTGPDAKSGQTVPGTYTYAAPPPNVTSIDVYADDHLLFNVPVTR